MFDLLADAVLITPNKADIYSDSGIKPATWQWHGEEGHDVSGEKTSQVNSNTLVRVLLVYWKRYIYLLFKCVKSKHGDIPLMNLICGVTYAHIE